MVSHRIFIKVCTEQYELHFVAEPFLFFSLLERILKKLDLFFLFIYLFWASFVPVLLNKSSISLSLDCA